jgi:uncharacterized protein (TIGR02453 family)
MVQFFRSLKRNNRREWFQPRKHVYEQHVKEPMLELVAVLNAGLAKFAPEFVTDPKKALFRIYRDTRFSADKTPYKTHVAAVFSRRGSGLMGAGGYYFSVSHDTIEVAGGIYHPEPETMLLVRTHIAENYEDLRRVLANKKTKKLVGELQGDELSRAPKGFDPGHPALDLIKKKDWIFDVTLPPSLATTPKLQGEILDRFRAMSQLIEFLNRPLLARKPARDPLTVTF